MRERVSSTSFSRRRISLVSEATLPSSSPDEEEEEEEEEKRSSKRGSNSNGRVMSSRTEEQQKRLLRAITIPKRQPTRPLELPNECFILICTQQHAHDTEKKKIDATEFHEKWKSGNVLRPFRQISTTILKLALRCAVCSVQYFDRVHNNVSTYTAVAVYITVHCQ